MDDPLVTVTRTQGNNRALKDGLVSSANFQLEFHDVPVLVNAFRSMVRDLAYDVCEMAVTTYLVAKAHGKPFTALPVFLVRGFHHGAIVVRAGGEIRHPKDLENRRVGVNRGYTVTTGVWARGVLHDEYGVDLDSITWVLSGDEHVSEYQPPPNVVTLSRGETLEDLVATGELAGAIGIEAHGDRFEPLIPHAGEAGYAALTARGYYPINHLIVVRDDLLAAHPDLAADLFQAFAASKRLYVQNLRTGDIDAPSAVDVMHARVMELTGNDPLPYGIEPNEAILEDLLRQARGQRILDTTPKVSDLFAAGTHDLLG
ncbi:MAG TPA: ABC transporter substrate-binding protein [Micromonosporaceae bacterium]|jgi:4,5-dihydroxyphthalate decarboxylase